MAGLGAGLSGTGSGQLGEVRRTPYGLRPGGSSFGFSSSFEVFDSLGVPARRARDRRRPRIERSADHRAARHHRHFLIFADLALGWCADRHQRVPLSAWASHLRGRRHDHRWGRAAASPSAVARVIDEVGDRRRRPQLLAPGRLLPAREPGKGVRLPRRWSRSRLPAPRPGRRPHDRLDRLAADVPHLRGPDHRRRSSSVLLPPAGADAGLHGAPGVGLTRRSRRRGRAAVLRRGVADGVGGPHAAAARSSPTAPSAWR